MMNFTLDDIAQEESQVCDVILKGEDNCFELTIKMELISAVSTRGQESRDAFLAAYNDKDASPAERENSVVESTLNMVVGWPEESNAFFKCEFSRKNLEKVLRTQALNMFIPAIREASSLSRNFISTALLNPTSS